MATTNNIPLPAATGKESPTWMAHVLIPLTQNLLGGLAVSSLTLIAYYAVSNWLGSAMETKSALLWNGLIGAVVASGFTVVRFFGDDLGILTGAYRAGQASRDIEVNALSLELQECQRLIDQLNGITINNRQRDELIDRCQRSRDHALDLVRRRLAGEEYRRKQLDASRVINQHDWGRAHKLLCQAGVIDRHTKMMTARTVAEAQRALDPVYKNGLEMAKRGGRPAWLVA